MARSRNGSNGRKGSQGQGSASATTVAAVSGGVATAQEAYVSALTGGLTESATAIEKIQADIAGLNTQMAAQVAQLRTHRSQLQTLGVTLPEIPAAVLPLIADETETVAPVRRGRGRPAGTGRRGRPAGSKNAPKTASGKRFKNEGNLVESLQGVLKGKQMSVSDAAQAVLDSGYRTTSTGNFRVMVNQALIASGAFKRVSRGVYTAK